MKTTERPSSTLSPRKRGLFRLISLLLLLLVAELGAYITLQIVGRVYVMDAIAEIQPDQVESFLVRRYDPDLGWRALETEVNSLGARSPHDYDDLEQSISVYGDSYAYGDGVAVEDCWAMQLERLSQRGVLNFGVGGYGTDQAMMRLERNYAAAPSSTVLLCIQVENAIRNLNVYRGFYRSGFNPPKPRYVLDGDQLRVLNPFNSPEAVRDHLLEHPEKLSALGRNHDYCCQQMLLSGEPWRLEFPYIYQFAVRIPFLVERAKSMVTMQGRHVPLYEKDSEGLEIMQRIVERFCGFAKQQNFKPIVVIFPAPRDIFRFTKRGDINYQNLLNFLESEQITHLDFMEVMAAPDDPRSLMVNGNDHINEAGSKIVAAHLLEFLKQHDAIPNGH